MFKPWDELSRNEQLHVEYCEFYKEVHGIKARWVFDEHGQPRHTETEIEQMLQRLADESKVVFAEQEAEELRNITTFENKVKTICEETGKSREQIITWMFDAGNYNGDWDFYCYDLGIPYGYFKEFYQQAA